MGQTVPFLVPKTAFMVFVISMEIVQGVLQVIKGEHAMTVCI